MELKILFYFCTFLLLYSPVHAAWLTNSASDYVTIDDSAVLTLPDNDWTLFGRFRQKSNAGTGHNYLLGWGRQGAATGVAIRCHQATEVAAPDNISATIHDGTTAETLTTTSNPCATTTWQNFAVVRSGGDASNADFTLYVNGAIADGPQTDDAINAIDPIGACIARHFVTSACNATGSNDDAEFEDFGMWTRALSTAEIATLQKFSASCLPFRQAVFIPGIQSTHVPRGQLDLTLTNIGTFADGPPIIYCE